MNNQPKDHLDVRAENKANVLTALAEAFKRLPAPKKDAAPTTHEFVRILDTPTPDHVQKKFPLQIYCEYFPDVGPWFRGGKLPVTNPKVMKAIIDEHLAGEKTELLSAEDMATLRDTQAKLDELDKQAENFSNTSAFREHQQQGNRLIDAAVSSGAVPETQMRSLEAIRSDHAAKAKALHELSVKISQEAFPVTVRAVFKAFSIVRRKMMEIEEQEREHAAAFGLDWSPSWLFKNCAAIQIRTNPHRLKISAGSRTDPRHILEGIIEL